MKTIEFKTKIKNGIIKIPDNFNDFKDEKVKVILVKENDDFLNVNDKTERLKRYNELILNDTYPNIDKNIDIDELANEISDNTL